MKQGRQVFLPLGGKIQLLSCPGGGKKKKTLKVKLYLENYQAVKLSKSFFFLSLR